MVLLGPLARILEAEGQTGVPNGHEHQLSPFAEEWSPTGNQVDTPTAQILERDIVDTWFMDRSDDFGDSICIKLGNYLRIAF